jgi:Xaa-Pro aminopeptidase
MNQYKSNRKQLLQQLEKNSIVLVHSGNLKHKTQDQFYPFQVDKNFYYLTGIREENLILLMVKTKKSKKEFLFIQETTEFMKQWVGEKTSKETASKISGINESNIFFLEQFDGFLKSLLGEEDHYQVGEIETLYLDLFRVNKTSKPISFDVFETVLNNYKELKVKNVLRELNLLRMIKSEKEIKELKKSIEITKHGLNRIMKELPNRDNEHQIEADFNHEISLRGARGVAFDTILASGSNGCILHYEDNNSDLHNGDLLLCDLGALKTEYGADISRTYPINGVFTARQKEIYNIVLKCNKECIDFVKPGVTLREVHKKSLDVLAEECMKIGLISEVSHITKYYYHSVSHFLGLDTHDVGVSNIKLKPGMVITIEPGLYIKEEQIGIRIEDDILVTEDGSENLSKDIIKEVEEIESYMKA